MPHEPNWGLFPTQVNEQPAWVLADIAWGDGDHGKLKTLIHVRFPLKDVDEDGLPMQDSMPRVYEVEQAVVDALGAVLKAEHVGSVSCAKQRHMYFYAAGDRALADALRPMSAMFPDCAPSAMSRPDPEHALYRDLLTPNVWQLQFVKNAMVLSQLAEAGDNPEASRPVTHFAYFPTREGRDEFVESVAEDGFTVDEDSLNTTPDTSSALPWLAKFERDQVMDMEELTNITADLASRVDEIGGDYDGWETHVMRGDGAGDGPDA